MTIARVSFLLDTTDLHIDAEESIEDYAKRVIFEAARAHALKKLHEARRDKSLPQDEKAVAMARQLQSIMATMMAEVNLSVEVMPDDTHVETRLPFEHRYWD